MYPSRASWGLAKITQPTGTCMRRGMRRIYIGFGNLFLAYAPGYAPRPKASKFQPMLHGPEPSATFAMRLCAEPETPIGCLGQSSFEIGYALGMRWPHSSLVIWIQLEQNQDPTGIHLEHRPAVWEFISSLCARVCARAKSIQVPTYASWSRLTS